MEALANLAVSKVFIGHVRCVMDMSIKSLTSWEVPWTSVYHRRNVFIYARDISWAR